MKSIQNILEDIQRNLREITTEDLLSLQADKSALVIDVREPDETAHGIIPQSHIIPRGLLEMKITDLTTDDQKPIVIYCASGIRSSLAAHALSNMGYQQVYSLKGGIQSWKNQGHNLEIKKTLSTEARARYSAQTRIADVGEQGQAEILNAKVLIVGAGGLGSPASLYLAAAGVGHLGIIDDDVVDVGNLQRQVLHGMDRVGLPKVESALITLKNLNPMIDIQIYNQRLTADNVDTLFAQYDIIIDGVDNFQTRYLVNDACIKHKKINIHGSVFQFEGQCTVLCAPDGPCYRCLYQEPPPAQLAPNCAEAGVLGVLPGTVGLLQATEAIKSILGLGDSLIGRLLRYDAKSAHFQEFKIKKNPDCPVCWKSPDQIQYSNYEEFCQT